MLARHPGDGNDLGVLGKGDFTRLNSSHNLLLLPGINAYRHNHYKGFQPDFYPLDPFFILKNFGDDKALLFQSRQANRIAFFLYFCNQNLFEMTQEAIKLELIEWLTKLQSNETISYLKIIKDSMKEENDWWSSLSCEQISGIERGLKDIDEGRTIAHETVKQRYEL